MTKYKPIASTIVQAIATPNGWVRTAKTIIISGSTPSWMVKIVDEWVRGVQE